MRALNLRVLTAAGACAITIGIAGCGSDDDTSDEGNQTSQSTADEADDQAVVEQPDPLAALAGEWEYIVDPDRLYATLTIGTDGSVEYVTHSNTFCGAEVGTLSPGDADAHQLDLQSTSSDEAQCAEPQQRELTYDASADTLFVDDEGPYTRVA